MRTSEIRTTTAITRADVEELIGDVSDHLIALLLATGATRGELAEAAREIELGAGERREIDTPRVNELCELLREELEDDLWPDE